MCFKPKVFYYYVFNFIVAISILNVLKAREIVFFYFSIIAGCWQFISCHLGSMVYHLKKKIIKSRLFVTQFENRSSYRTIPLV